MGYQKYIGVDGCKAGWFYVGIDSHGECDFGIFKTLPELWQANRKDSLILVDIPIGLPSKTNSSRECDLLARKILRPLRQGAVFPPPVRKVLSATSFEQACQINNREVGKKISIMAWGITAKIKQADSLLQKLPEARQYIRECHPEICFCMLNGGRPMKHYKKELEGQEERLALLQGLYDKSRVIFKAAEDRFLRKEVARDDILDALAASMTGYLSRGDLATLPETPELDDRGLPMEMVYFQPDKDSLSTKTEATDIVSGLMDRCGSSGQVFPATELYNETWMLRLVVDWFSRNNVPGHPLNFSTGCRWFSEGQIPTQFQTTSRKDKLGEAWTHADCVIGHFDVGQTGKTDIQLSVDATHLACLEAKMFSRLSPGVSNARYYNQAARYVACIAEMLHRANREPEGFDHLGFYVIAPESQIAAGVFRFQVDNSNIRDIVQRRVSEYSGKKDQWFEKWFPPTLEAIKIECLSWESIIAGISEVDSNGGMAFGNFYDKCLTYNRPVKSA